MLPINDSPSTIRKYLVLYHNIIKINVMTKPDTLYQLYVRMARLFINFLLFAYRVVLRAIRVVHPLFCRMARHSGQIQ